MVSTSEFIKCVVVDILNRDLTSKDYVKFGGSPNIIRRCFERNKGIGSGVVEVISNLILYETKFDVMKKNLVLDYLRQFLNNREKEYLNRNENDIKTIMNFVAEKFNGRLKNGSNKVIKNAERFRVVDINKLLDMGWNIEEIVRAGISLDYETMEGLTEEHNGNLKQWVEIANTNADSIRWLLDGNKMIGYWHFTALFDEDFIKAKNGKLLDSEITCDKIPVLFPGTYNIYFIGICLKAPYRRKTVTFGKLLFNIIKVIEDFAKKEIFINEICALAYTHNGVQLCKSIGLKYVREHLEHGKIYCGNVIDLLNKDFCKNFVDLRTLYKKRYKL